MSNWRAAMSYSFRSLGVASVVLGFVPAAAGFAAELSVQPAASLSTSSNTNVALSPLPGDRESAQGYFADAQALIAYSTPIAQTTLLPRVVYNYFPSDTGLDRLEGSVDLSSQYKLELDRFSIRGRFDHLNELSAEAPAATYNAVNPGLPTTPGNGLVSVKQTRDYLTLLPFYSHKLSPTTEIGVSGNFQRMRYSPDDTSAHVDFNYYVARVFYGWEQTQRLDMTIAAYGSRYQAQSIDSRANSGGAEFDLGYNWSPILHSNITLQYQHTNTDEVSPKTFRYSSNPWALSVETVYTASTSRLRMNLGRSFAPGSSGGLYNTDEAHVQYERDLTARLEVVGALRFYRSQTIGALAGNDRHDYGVALASMSYALSRTLYVRGGYSYTHSRYRSDPDSANNSSFLLEVGYRGLEQQH
jgi:hypothetical protein